MHKQACLAQLLEGGSRSSAKTDFQNHSVNVVQPEEDPADGLALDLREGRHAIACYVNA